ncbi:MAG: endolytic transglycosylase MltG [Acidobacteria bacterium]|nr:endolytic transglycosylase MltG [Acidobacteriota bacterium]
MKRMLFLLVPACVLLSLGIASYLLVTHPYQGTPNEGVFVQIEPGMTAARIARVLEERGVLLTRQTFLAYLWLQGKTRLLKAGEYFFQGPVTQIQVVEKITEGKVYYRALTVPEGRNLFELAELVARQGLGSREDFLGAANRTRWIADLDDQAKNLEGYLFPDTYLLPRRISPEEIVRLMVQRFRQVFGPEFSHGAREQGLTIRQAVTLASLVERETGLDAERPLVAAVFHNRLRKGILLQCDPTVIYASLLVGKYDGNLRWSDLDLDSPYNTYKHSGLPPGPIANPGEKSLRAALYPAPVDYLYFVAQKDGTHLFSSDLRSHSRAVQKYQKVR